MDIELLKLVITEQQQIEVPEDFIPRMTMEEVTALRDSGQIIVITGIRRCGKSTLLQQLRSQESESHYFISFDDDRLVKFALEDFQLLLEVFIELFGEQKTFYFDEIQNIPGWERFIRRLHDQGNRIYITGSNANLFSQELGTRLTGRYIPVKLYPFSFEELLFAHAPSLQKVKTYSTVQKGNIKKVLSDFIQFGGIPDYVKTKKQEYLHALYESIIYRDIITRYKLPNEKPLKELVYYLASNVGKEVSYNGLRKILGLGSATTVAEYGAYLEGSFICFFINRYDYSLKKQMLYNKKVYFIDQAFAVSLGFRFSEDRGRILENIVFLELKRRYTDIYFHKQEKECDFIVREASKITMAIQVCANLHDAETRLREYDGLLEALATYKLTEGYIINDSLDKIDEVLYQGKKYKLILVPLWKWLISSY